MNLQFPISKILELSQCYVDSLNERDLYLTQTIEGQVFPSYAAKGYLSKDEFLTVCQWTSSRSKPWFQKNEEEFVKDVSTAALTTESERLRLQLWTLLSGVRWSIASVFIHFAFPNQYPVLDFRSLRSLGREAPAKYDFEMWWEYTEYCRSLAAEAGVTMRVLDQALSHYSALSQTNQVFQATLD